MKKSKKKYSIIFGLKKCGFTFIFQDEQHYFGERKNGLDVSGFGRII